jgi:signal peptidase II
MSSVNILCVTFVVLVSDQVLRIFLHRAMTPAVLALDPLGSVQLAVGRLWLRRFCKRNSCLTLWWLWAAAAAILIFVSTMIPSSAPFVGLLLGGSLSNVIESSVRGYITDYICLVFWPAFNLADMAIVAGAIGMIGELLLIIRAMVF